VFKRANQHAFEPAGEKKDTALKKSAFFINFFVARQGAVVVHI
jgi:hypothetical protein